MTPSHRPLLRALYASVLLTCVACTAEPVAVMPPAGPVVSHPVVALLDRVAQATGAPDLVGSDAATAQAALADQGLAVRLVAVGEGDRVSAQYPGPGVPADEGVVLWIGVPPDPPEPQPTPQPTPSVAARNAGAGQRSGPAPDPAAPGTPAPASGASGAGTDQATPPPAATEAGPGARTNIRILSPAEPGTSLRGPASWYGPGFAGNRTACLGVFDPGELTLASRELRCGTTVRVTGPTGAAVTATVTDWGPAEWTERRFDLSRATFAAIHHLGAGVIDVSVTVVEP